MAQPVAKRIWTSRPHWIFVCGTVLIAAAIFVRKEIHSQVASALDAKIVIADPSEGTLVVWQR